MVLCDKEIPSITVADIEFIFIQEIKDIKTRDNFKLNLRHNIFGRTFIDGNGFYGFRSLRITVNKSLEDVGEREGGSKWIRQTWRLQELNFRLSSQQCQAMIN